MDLTKLKTLKITDLVHPEYNPRFMPEDQMKALEAEVDEFGMVENIVVNQRNMHIVGGNQRVYMLERKGETSVVAYMVDLEDEAEKRLNLALNKISGQWDDVKLQELLAEIEITNTGFTDEEVEALLQKAEIADLPPPDLLQLNEKVWFEFGDLKGDIPHTIYLNFLNEMNRIKKHLFPNEKTDDVSVISPLEYLVANSANTPLP